MAVEATSQKQSHLKLPLITAETIDSYPHENALVIQGKENIFMCKQNGRLFLVDGDNHIYEGLSGVMNTRKEDTVQVYVSQGGLVRKLRKKYGNRINIKKVRSGDQAVDNVIKSRLGNEAGRKDFSEVVVLSHDKGYKRQIDKARNKGKKKFRQAKSIKQAIKPYTKSNNGLHK